MDIKQAKQELRQTIRAYTARTEAPGLTRSAGSALYNGTGFAQSALWLLLFQRGSQRAPRKIQMQKLLPCRRPFFV